MLKLTIPLLLLGAQAVNRKSALSAIRALPDSYNDIRRYQKAMKLMKRVFNISSRMLGNEHSDTLEAMDWLEVYYIKSVSPREAMELAETVFEVKQKLLGDEHPDILYSM
jgi:hypothetical protein